MGVRIDTITVESPIRKGHLLKVPRETLYISQDDVYTEAWRLSTKRMVVAKHLLSEEIGGHGFDREGQFWGVSRNGGAELSPSPPSTANIVS